jgi:biopolymer transport protein ExbD
MAKVKRGTKPETQIPTTSMGDISFLLLLFFMVSTVFVKERGLEVVLPKARGIEKIPRKNASTIYVNRMGTISIDDYAVEIPQVSLVMRQKLAENINMMTCFRTDKDTNYGIMSDILNQLKEANALRVQFEAKLLR